MSCMFNNCNTHQSSIWMTHFLEKNKVNLYVIDEFKDLFQTGILYFITFLCLLSSKAVLVVKNVAKSKQSFKLELLCESIHVFLLFLSKYNYFFKLLESNNWNIIFYLYCKWTSEIRNCLAARSIRTYLLSFDEMKEHMGFEGSNTDLSPMLD